MPRRTPADPGRGAQRLRRQGLQRPCPFYFHICNGNCLTMDDEGREMPDLGGRAGRPAASAALRNCPVISTALPGGRTVPELAGRRGGSRPGPAPPASVAGTLAACPGSGRSRSRHDQPIGTRRPAEGSRFFGHPAASPNPATAQPRRPAAAGRRGRSGVEMAPLAAPVDPVIVASPVRALLPNQRPGA